MRKIILLAVLVMALGYVVFAWATVDRRSDAMRISSMIQAAARAVPRRDLNTIISCLSSHYTDDQGLNYDTLRMFLARALWDKDQRYKCQVRIQKLTITGDNAEAEIHATVTSINSGDKVYDRTLTLVFMLEKGRHAVIWPIRIWRVTGSRNAALDVESML
jgi:hypothetical protein